MSFERNIQVFSPDMRNISYLFAFPIWRSFSASFADPKIRKNR